MFFDNVGSVILDAVLRNMAARSRIATCGAIAQYDKAADGQFTGLRNLPMLIFKQARMEGYVAGQFGERNEEILDTLSRMHVAGQINA